jgi:hypothetical protein
MAWPVVFWTFQHGLTSFLKLTLCIQLVLGRLKTQDFKFCHLSIATKSRPALLTFVVALYTGMLFRFPVMHFHW